MAIRKTMRQVTEWLKADSKTFNRLAGYEGETFTHAEVIMTHLVGLAILGIIILAGCIE